MGLQKKYFPVIYNYKNELLCILEEAINIVEDKKLNELDSLTFQYPVKLFDYYGNPILDDNENQVKNPKLNYIINDNLILFKETWYIIKINNDVLNNSNETFINVSAHEIGYELTEKFVQYLNLSPPIHDAVDVQDAFSEILEGMQQIRDNFAQVSTSATITLDADAHPSDDFYNGYKIKIIIGSGTGEEKTIIDYDGSTKVATIDSAWTNSPDNESVFRIYNDIWQVGTIDSVFLTNLRGHLFDYVTCMDALIKAKNQYIDPNTKLTGYLTYSASYDNINNRWIKLVNLVKANPYNGVDIRYKKNMQSLNRKIDSEKIYTKIIFEGKDNLTISDESSETRIDNGTTYYTHIKGDNNAINFQYFLQNYTLKECYDNFIKEYHFSDTRYVDSGDMYSDGKELLERISMPKITYSTSILDLSTIDGMEYEKFNIGDTIKVYNEDLGIDVYATVENKSIPENNPQNATVELTNFVDKMSDLLDRIMNRSDTKLNRDKSYGKSVTYVIADKKTSTNWRNADFFVGETETTDDILNKVLDSMSTTGGKITFLDGNFYFKSRIDIKIDNVIIEGQGNSTVFKLRNGFSTPSTLGFIEFEISNNTTIKNIKIDGQVSSGYSMVGIRTLACDNCRLSGIDITNTLGKGIDLAIGTNNIISDINITNVTDNSGDSYGIKISLSHDNIIENVNISDDISDGIYSDSSSHDNSFKNVNAKNINNHGFNIDSQNDVYDNCVADSNGGNGFNFTSQQSNTLLNSCKSLSNSGDGIYAINSKNIKINNILVDGNTTKGINLLGSCSNTHIDNSTVINSGDEGIKIDINSVDSWINSCYVYNNVSKNIDVLADRTIIRDSKVKDGSVSVANYGIYIAIASDCFVINNDLRGAGATEDFHDGGTNTHIVSENLV